MRKPKQTPKVLSAKTCKEFTELIADYVTDQLKPSLKREFERHLKICPDCVNFLNTYKKTVSVKRFLDVTAIPVKVRDNVLAFLRKKMRRIAAVLLYLASQI